MEVIFPLAVSALGLAGIYFMLAVGLSLIFGLMHVLTLAHGALFVCGAYVAVGVMNDVTFLPPTLRFAAALILAGVVTLLVGAFIERVLLRSTYGQNYTQMIITLGLSFAIAAFLGGWLGHDAVRLPLPDWYSGVIVIGDSRLVTGRIFIAVAASVVFLLVLWFMRRSGHGLIIRAGVENRQMVSALGIDVSRSFTLVFALGSALAGIGGVLAASFYGVVTPALGSEQLIFAFIVIIIGGLGTVEGTALAALLVALLQQFLNFYGPAGLGDIVTIVLLAAVLLLRPQGLLGKRALV